MLWKLLQRDANVTYHESVPWQRGEQQRPAIPAGHELETAIPARPANLASDVAVPLLQAAVTGALVGLLALIAGSLARWDVDPLRLWAAVALAVAVVAWLVLLGQTRRLLWAVERLVGLDLDGDGRQGEPCERVVIVNGRRPGDRPARREELTGMMGFVARLQIKGAALRDWEGELGRDTYNRYRDALISSGWADWKSYGADGKPNERQGWDLTADVAEVLEHIVE